MFHKFDECENCTTVAIQMKNSIKNTTIASYAKTAVENYVVNESSNETSKLKVLTYISAAQQPITSQKKKFAQFKHGCLETVYISWHDF